MRIDLGELKPSAPWKELGRNVMGELQISVMLGRQGSKAAAGWDGDKYAVFEGTDGKLGLVWFSTWDNSDEAREFAEAYVRYQTRRMGKDAFHPEHIPDSLWRCQNEVCQVVDRHGADVVVIEGFAPADTTKVLEAASHARKREYQPQVKKEAGRG
jgi:hypothetical protein